MHALVALACLFIGSIYADALLTNARFSTCGARICVEIISQRAVQGHLGPSLYFSSPLVRIVEKGKPERSWQASSVYFDTTTNRLFIRALSREKKIYDAYYEIDGGILHFIRAPRTL